MASDSWTLATDSKSNWTLKIDIGGDVRRRPWPLNDEEISVDSLREVTAKLFSLDMQKASNLSLKYRDEDGDQCTLDEATLPDAIALADKTRIIRLQAAFPEVDIGSTEGTVARATVEPSSPAVATSGGDSPVCGARQRVAENFNRFTQQVTHDFQKSRQDMNDAFDPEGTGNARVGPIVSTATGLAVAARLIPIRATRLAAESMAAVSGHHCASSSSDMEIENQQDVSVQPETQTEGMTRNRDNVAHFHQQVAQDFQNARQEVGAALGCVFAKRKDPERSTDLDVSPRSQLAAAAESSSSEPPRAGYREVVPAIAGTVAGLLVATTLVPFRAARLAVATASASSSSVPAMTTQGSDDMEVDTEGPVVHEVSDGDDDDDANGQRGSGQEQDLVADEELARKLQAEWMDEDDDDWRQLRM
eukprot:TRINITY_DN3922_c0_g5_i1.p1 TRINITY_DN3922_c0_g5~~TRINITY_DN3922_c0_g5_i1.p1  ORF type:complete len:419 (-),score=76.94 TRINITY_DN3922_c0_g5_i1:368-1624(-)